MSRVGFASFGDVRRAFGLAHDVPDDANVAAEVVIPNAVDGVSVGVGGIAAGLDQAAFTNVGLDVPVEKLNHTSGIHL